LRRKKEGGRRQDRAKLYGQSLKKEIKEMGLGVGGGGGGGDGSGDGMWLRVKGVKGG